jgi:GT2 family glycosyltransferase
MEPFPDGGRTASAAPDAPAAPPPATAPVAGFRPRVHGKYLYAGDDRLLVRGVSYGAFEPDRDGREYHDLETIERDFAAMAENAVTVVRIPHTTPPVELLDVAGRHGLRVMVGLSAEQYVGYLIDRKGAPDVAAVVREKVRTVAGHPALLAYGLGNEIPAPMARWIGREAIERYLERLYDTVKDEDPDGLVTYVNYPSTEYLQLPFLDFVSFNVYLERRERLAAYLPRLHNLAGDRPLVLTELGLDAYRNGEEAQAASLRWQLEEAYEAGCAGTVVFAWTDEWFRAGEHVDDWEFGLTRRDRSPKPALDVVRDAYSSPIAAPAGGWPSVSVVVCTYNGGRTIGETLAALGRLDYPDYEVVVVDDGSTDGGAECALEHGFQLVRSENAGLSNARNLGLAHARGELVAYIDDDAYPEPDWLTHLALAFARSDHVAIGGPNIPPDGDGAVAECVAHAPGGPAHVLLSDVEAEHIPGCNMAFRRAALEAVGGFDPEFRIAGDDVDLCWRLQERGWTLGFSPAAVVWHHRRNSVRAYLRQQRNYGRAEALLERKWPDKYSSLGHVRWHGRVYGSGFMQSLRTARVYHGRWGLAPFQGLYAKQPGLLRSLPSMPEWYLALAVLAAMSLLSPAWTPLLVAVPLLAAMVLISIVQVWPAVRRIRFHASSRRDRLRRRALTELLFLAQPAVRLTGRLSLGLAPWRRRAPIRLRWPRRETFSVWCEEWVEPEERLAQLEQALIRAGQAVGHGGPYDRWDLEIRVGLLGGARLRTAIEDHGAGTQLVRFEVRPRWALASALTALALALIAGSAAEDAAWLAFALLAGGAAAIAAGVVLAPAAAVALAGRVAREVTTDVIPRWGGHPPAFARVREPRVPDLHR